MLNKFIELIDSIRIIKYNEIKKYTLQTNNIKIDVDVKMEKQLFRN